MGIFKDLTSNITMLSKRITTNTPMGNQEVGLAQINITGQVPEDRQAVYPQWFFSSRLGQPRQVDTLKMRNLSQSPWVQMVLNTFKKQVFTTEWEIVNADPEDETDRKPDIQKVKEFLSHINYNEQSIDDVNSETITDVGEIDAGAWNLVYSNESYTMGEIPVYDAWGRILSTEAGLVLKPLGQREIVAVKAVDGSSMLKQVDIHKNLLNYWQYSFKHPRQNPTRFEKEEICYLMMNNKSYSVYGFSPVQAIQQVLELLIQGTRYNKDLYTNNAIPDLLVSLPKLPNDKLKKLRRTWNNNYKGKPHQVGFINWLIENVHKLSENNRDLEWLGGQEWYNRIVFAVFGVSPEEAGFTQNSNRATGDSQERVTVRNAVKPYFKLFEKNITNKLIKEILQKEDHGLKFKYKPKDHTLEKIEFEQDMQELDHDTLTINEFRKKKGRDPVTWGDEQSKKPFDANSLFGGNGQTPPNSSKPPNSNGNNPKPEKDKNKDFKKNFEAFVNDSKQRAYS